MEMDFDEQGEWDLKDEIGLLKSKTSRIFASSLLTSNKPVVARRVCNRCK